MKVRISQWLDTERRVPVFGIQVRTEDGWKNVAVDGKPAFFKTAIEAGQKAERLNLASIAEA